MSQRSHWRGVTRGPIILAAIVCFLMAVSSPSSAQDAETEAKSDGAVLTASGARAYTGQYSNWTDPCDGEWRNPTSGIGISLNGEDEDGNETNTAVVIETREYRFIPVPIPTDISIDRDEGARDATGIGQIDETIEFGGGEYTVWINDDCPWGQEVSYVPVSAVQLLPDFQALAQDYLTEPKLTLKPFDPERDWTYVNVPIDFRTTPESVEPVVVTIDSGVPTQYG